jgi:ribosomal subunit interface protein
VEIVVTGRNVEIPEHFKVHASEKLARIERYDPKLARVAVELSHEGNPRQAKSRQRVQLTVTGRGPAVRAEAAAESFHAALDLAAAKLEGRLRKARGRRLGRVTTRTPVGEVAAEVDVDGLPPVDEAPRGAVGVAVDADAYDTGADGGPGQIVRIKDHPGDPITVDQALWQMELVGHDFYLFNDSETGRPTVVYRRRGFDYGLLRLAEG